MEGKSGRSSLLFESGPPENWGALATTSEGTLGTHMDSLDVIAAPLLAHHDLSVRQLTPRNGIASGDEAWVESLMGATAWRVGTADFTALHVRASCVGGEF